MIRVLLTLVWEVELSSFLDDSVVTSRPRGNMPHDQLQSASIDFFCTAKTLNVDMKQTGCLLMMPAELWVGPSVYLYIFDDRLLLEPTKSRPNSTADLEYTDQSRRHIFLCAGGWNSDMGLAPPAEFFGRVFSVLDQSFDYSRWFGFGFDNACIWHKFFGQRTNASKLHLFKSSRSTKPCTDLL